MRLKQRWLEAENLTMETFSGLLALLAAIAAAGYIVWPFFQPRSRAKEALASRHSSTILRQRANLLAERNHIYRALSELDFDYETGEISDDDYAAQRYRLVARGVEVLQQLDALPAASETSGGDPIEVAVLALRTGVGKGPSAGGR